MGDSVEDLLNQIKKQYGDDSQSPPPTVSRSEPSSQSLASQSEFSPASEPAFSGSIDDLLADISGKPSPVQPSGHSQSPPIPSLSSTPPPDWQTTIFLPDEKQSFQTDEKTDHVKKVSTDRLLDDLKAQYIERDRAEALKQEEQRRVEALKQQAQLQQEQRRQAELKRQKHKAILQQAEEWLKRLDPRSGEAIWFEEFAAKYESRLEAAIDYLGLDP